LLVVLSDFTRFVVQAESVISEVMRMHCINCFKLILFFKSKVVR